ncbi:MAG: HupE/UreJ family protein [Porticoccaceae bacterium]|nr:HupE/UreJ family protein [Porticoccaceae bacterium]
MDYCLRLATLTIFILSVYLSVVSSVHAHESRPLFLEVTDKGTGSYHTLLKIPPGLDGNNHPEIIFQQCQKEKEKLQFTRTDSIVYMQSLQCLEGLTTLEINYPNYQSPLSTLVRIKRISGEIQTKLLNPGESTWEIPRGETPFAIFLSYCQMGIFHIWEGVDHLLFLVCLVFIAGAGKRIFITITGFTIAHSLTLTLSALQWVKLSVGPVEAVIALSVVFLAREIARSRAESLTWSYPILVSSSFGLLHGFGFASVLNEIGLPQTELLNGLLSFNLGVELGQLVFIGVMLALYRVVTNLGYVQIFRKLERPVIYGVGITASYWLFERSARFMALS